MDHQQLTWNRETGTAIASLSGELDLASAADTFAAVRAGLDGEGGVIVDLSGVWFMDSIALREIVQLAQDRAIKLVAPQGTAPRKVLALTAVDTVVATFETTEAAIGGQLRPMGVEGFDDFIAQ